jgi:beta-1,4-mannosyltransferase
MAFKISSFPGWSSNPYLDLFYEALVPYGVERAEGFLLSPKWLLAKRGEVDAIHFHWPEWLWGGRMDGVPWDFGRSSRYLRMT